MKLQNKFFLINYLLFSSFFTVVIKTSEVNPDNYKELNLYFNNRVNELINIVPDDSIIGVNRLTYRKPHVPFSPLTYYICKHKQEKVLELIENGADVNIKDNRDGYFALMITAEHMPNVVPMLIDAGAEVNATANFGWTALIYACWWSNPEAVLSLLNNGANPNVQNGRGSTALMFICSNNTKPIKLLKEPDNNYRIMLINENKNNLEIVSSLLDAGADPDLQNSNGWTALMMACQKKYGSNVYLTVQYKSPYKAFLQNTQVDKEIIALLINAEADLNLRSYNGSTALMFALSRDGEDSHTIVEMLLQAGADVNIRDSNYRTALTIACKYNPETVQILLDAGAEVDAKTLKKAEKHNPNLIELLEEN